MPSFIRVPFATNLISESLRYSSDLCVMVFPTEISASVARREFQSTWLLQDCQFISMDQLKKDLLLPSEPSLSDDKRLLCLYLALSEEDRSFFHISGYFDVVEWGQSFLHFFEELADECVDVNKLEDVFGNFGFNLLSWQESNLTEILNIRKRYLDLLTQSGLSDAIFTTIDSYTALNPLPKRMVFVNQYYYSDMELALISKLEESGCEIIIIEQTIASNQETSNIELTELQTGQFRTKKIQVIECGNDDQMIVAFLAQIQGGEEWCRQNSVIVDSHFHQKHYRHMFDPQYFAISDARSIMHFGVYKTLSTLWEHLEAMEKSLDQSFLPIRMIIASCTQEQFIAYYQPDWNWEERSKLLDELRYLLDQSILYIDKDLTILHLLKKKQDFVYLPQLLLPHFALMQRLSSIERPQDLINLIDAQDGLIIKKMCSAQELKYSDVLEKCYERLGNFAALDDFGIVSSWRGFFSAGDTNPAVQILQLLFETLSNVRIQMRQASHPESNRTDISNVLNLRNLQYETTIFFHTIEGEYPSNPGPTWLFNENQRASIGLKSYPDLRSRERYYFLRQVLSSENVVLYSYRNQEQDIEPGSFLTELLHHKAHLEELGIEFETTTVHPSVESLYSARKALYSPAFTDLMAALNNENHGLDKDDTDAFFTLPASPAHDFGEEHALKAAFYSLKTLADNPFLWYINYRDRLRVLEYRPQETITNKLFGSMLHGFMSKVLKPLRGNQNGCAELAKVLDDPRHLNKNLSELINESLYLFKLPQNYNHEFLVSVISECLVSSIRQFYWKFLLPKLNSTRYEFIPEAEDFSDLTAHKKLTKCVYDEVEYSLNILGKADLRIECPNEYMIIDFKTGRGSVEQLVCYEWFYYLLNEDFEGTTLSSTFWKILEPGTSENTTDKKRNAWKEKMTLRFEECLRYGFTQGKTAASRKELVPITRADIYLVTSGGSDE